MITPLKEIQAGEDITAAFLNAIVRQLRAFAPQSSGDILPNVQPGGTTYKLCRRVGVSKNSGLDPFEPYQFTPNPSSPSASDWRTFRIHTGNIWAPYKSTSMTASNDDAGTPLAIVVPASTSKYKIWLEMTLGAGFFTAITINSGAAAWTGYPSNSATKWFVLIAEISTSDDTAKQATIYQRVSDSLILAAPVMPVTVTQTGGSAGTKTALCSFTYTVADLLGVTIGTVKAPKFSPARIVKTVCVAGTSGTAYYDNAGVLQLASVDETANQNNCA